MQSTELRIGNLITLDENQRRDLWDNQIHAMNDFFEVKTIYSDGGIALQLDDEIVDINVDDVSPIPLTEEWLLKFRFEWKIQHQGFYNGRFKIDEKYKEGYRLYFGNEKIDVKYVHQLQNLYFSLTGEELNYHKLKPL